MTFPRAVAWRSTARSRFFEGPSTRAYPLISTLVLWAGINQVSYTLVVDYLDNSSQAILEFAVCEENHAADFDLPPLRGGNIDFGHHVFV